MFGRVDVEGAAREGVDAGGEVVHGDGESGVLRAEEIGVDAAAGLFHVQEHGDEWEVDGFVCAGEFGFFDMWAQ